MKTIIPSSDVPWRKSGRWSERLKGSMIASWTSASVSFLFSGSKLSIAIGEATERKDKENGGTPMLAIITGENEEDALKNPTTWKTADAHPSRDLVIFDEEAGGKLYDEHFVRIILIDWASQVEITGLVTDENARIEAPDSPSEDALQILLIGNSILSTMAVSVEQGGEPIPHGILDGYSYVAQRLLLQKIPRKKIELELVAYPGINLVPPTEEEKVKGHPSGMVDAFFWSSIWAKGSFEPTSSPSVVVIALGTNDQAFEISKDRFGLALVDLVSKIKAASSTSIKQVWLVPPFPDADTNNRELNDAMPSFIPLLEERIGGDIVYKICDLVDGLTVKDTVDGVHPSLKVQQVIGKKLEEFIEKELYA